MLGRTPSYTARLAWDPLIGAPEEPDVTVTEQQPIALPIAAVFDDAPARELSPPPEPASHRR